MHDTPTPTYYCDNPSFVKEQNTTNHQPRLHSDRCESNSVATIGHDWKQSRLRFLHHAFGKQI